MGRYKGYSEYRESGVEWIGLLPKEWAVLPLKRSLKLVTERAEQKSNPVGLENIESWSARFNPTETEFEGTGIAFREGDILFGKLRPYLAKAYLAKFEGEAIGDFHVMRPEANCEGQYALYQILQNSFISVVDGATHGAKMPRVGWEFMGNIPFVYPSLEEQVQIAKFLDHETAKIDTLISKQERLIELLQEKRQAVISHAVTKGLDGAVGMKDSGVEWLGEVPEHWLTTSFKYKISTTKGVAFKSADFVSEGVKVVRASDIKNKTIQYSGVYLPVVFLNEYKNVILKTGDIILSTVGSTPDVKNSAVGQVGMLPLDLNGSLLNQNTVIFAPEENLNNNYLFWLIQSSMYREHLNLNAHGTANQASLSLESMLSFRVAIPDYDEQLLIHNYLEDRVRKLDKLEKNSQDMISLLKERRAALISAAVTGKIDVREVELS